MDKISIIIPVYNVEPYIKKCLDSIINQTHTNLEILLIDDGSTDNSGKICNEYAGKDNRIKVVHKENGGESSARNVGLNIFTGDYVGFVDADDWIEPNMYEILYQSAHEKNVSISVASYFKDTDIKSIPITNKLQIPDDIINTKDMLLYPLKRDFYMGFCGYIWNKLFSADIFRNHEIKFDDDMIFGGDVLLYALAVIKNKSSGVYVDKPLYHYYQRADSITKSKSVTVKKSILSAYKKMELLFNDNGYSDISFWARGFYCYHASVAAEVAIANNDIETLRQMQVKIKIHLGDYIKTNEKFPEKLGRIYELLKR